MEFSIIVQLILDTDSERCCTLKKRAKNSMPKGAEIPTYTDNAISGALTLVHNSPEPPKQTFTRQTAEQLGLRPEEQSRFGYVVFMQGKGHFSENELSNQDTETTLEIDIFLKTPVNEREKPQMFETPKDQLSLLYQAVKQQTMHAQEKLQLASRSESYSVTSRKGDSMTRMNILDIGTAEERIEIIHEAPHEEIAGVVVTGLRESIVITEMGDFSYASFIKLSREDSPKAHEEYAVESGREKITEAELSAIHRVTTIISPPMAAAA